MESKYRDLIIEEVELDMNNPRIKTANKNKKIKKYPFFFANFELTKVIATLLIKVVLDKA